MNFFCPLPPGSNDRGSRAGRNIVICLVWLFVFVAGLATPLWGDDWCRQNVIDLGAIFSSVTREYFDWTGRIAPILFTYVTLGPGRAIPLPWFEAVNALVFVALLVLLISLAERVSQRSATAGGFARVFATWLLAGLMLWWLPRTIGEVALWKTGAIAYLWAVTLSLFLVERAIAWQAEDRAPRTIIVAGLGLLALATGTFLETIAIVTTFLLLALAARAYLRGLCVARAIAVVAGMHLFGMAILLAAPGNFQRASDLTPTSFSSQIDGWIGFLGRLFDPIWIVAALLLVAAWCLPDRWFNRSKAAPVLSAPVPWFLTLPFVLIALLYLLSLLPIPRDAFSARLSFPASVALIGALFVLLVARPTSTLRDKVLASVVALVFMFQAALVARDLAILAAVQPRWESAIAAAPPEASEVLLPMLRERHKHSYALKHRFFVGIGPDPTAWMNICYARAMGVQSVRGI
jgi:hypothetical protein